MLLQLIQQYEDGNKTRFAKRLGLTPQGISTWLSRGTIDYELVYAKCEELDAAWLLTGEGSMLRSEPQSQTNQAHHQDLSGEAAAYYRLYEKKDAEVGALKEEIGALKAKLAQYESQTEASKEHPKGLDSSETVKDAHIRKHTPGSEHYSDRTNFQTENP